MATSRVEGIGVRISVYSQGRGGLLCVLSVDVLFTRDRDRPGCESFGLLVGDEVLWLAGLKVRRLQEG